MKRFRGNPESPLRQAAGFFRTAVDRAEKGLLVLGVVSLLVMIIIAVLESILRRFYKPIPGAANLGAFLFVVIVFLGLAEAQAKKAHIRVDFLVSRFPERMAAFLTAFSLSLMLLVSTLIAWQGWDGAWQSLQIRESTETSPYYPIYVFKFAVPLGFFLLWVQLALDIVNTVREWRKRW